MDYVVHLHQQLHHAAHKLKGSREKLSALPENLKTVTIDKLHIAPMVKPEDFFIFA
jgi:hypothetical protein